MYISKIYISNFRGFRNSVVIDFHEGINVIIGANNSGKSNLLKALSLIFSDKNKRLTTDDFNKQMTIQEIKKRPPKVQISAFIKESDSEELYSDDLVTVSTALVKLEKPYEARLTYEFYLPENELGEYSEKINQARTDDIEDYWKIIKDYFIRKYTYKIFVGNPENKTIVDYDVLNKFDFQFLDAIRDVERDMFTGKNILLKEVLDFFIDYDIKNDSSKKKEEKIEAINEKREKFRKDAKNLIDNLQGRMQIGKEEILKYAKETGASIGNVIPNIEGEITDNELLSALKLIVEYETGVKLPASHNGLGYNNLIYISLLLSKMQKDASGEYLGSNAKIFPILAIEEPEAHLHPSMQYKFLKFLKNNQKREVRQIFITTHSPNITAAIDLDDIIVFCINSKNEINIGYPGKVFGDSPDDQKSKAYVSRFLDVTKSDMIFAKGIIFVEGISEQLLLPTLAEKIKEDLIGNHITVINIGGRYFDHFLKMFDSNKEYSINKKVACITDLDPQRKKKGSQHFSNCYPFELDIDKENYKYKCCSNQIVEKYNEQKNHPNIRCFSQQIGFGKTFEYELILCNPCSEILLTESMSNPEEIKDLMNAYKNNDKVENMLSLLSTNNEQNIRIKDSIKNNNNIEWNDDEKRKHVIAARYLNSIEKGLNSLEITQKLAKNEINIEVPEYIGEAIKWICQDIE
jgi:putative ATP-dependent endonuclease of the OLD family